MDRVLRGQILRQSGAVSRAQALSAGVSARQIDRLLASQEWLRVWPGVYRVHTSVPLPETTVWGASLWLGPQAHLAGAGALWWWETVPEPPNHFVFTRNPRLRSAGPVRVVEWFVDPHDRSTSRGIPVVSRPLAVLQTAAAEERSRAGRGISMIDLAKQQRAVRQVDLERSFARHPGCWGSSTIRTLLLRTGDRAQSELERVAVALLTEAGISGFEPNLTVRLGNGRAAEIDIAFADRRIAIELDGYAYHANAAAFRRDVVKSNQLMNDGWTVRRFTWDDVVGDPEGFVAAVCELLGQ